MRMIVLAIMLALTACGGGDKTPDAAASTAPPAKHKGLTCTGFPDFVALPPDAEVTTCNNGNSKAAHLAGTIVFGTDMTPKDAAAFFKEKAGTSGLPEVASNSRPDASTYVANDPVTVRSIAVTTERRAAGGTKVTVNWGKENWDAPANAGGSQRNSGGD